MKIVLAFDSFKESLSSLEAANFFSKGFQRIFPDSLVETLLLSDGGEGFVTALTHQNGQIHYQEVHGPLDTTVQACYGILSEKNVAVIEMASASGLELVPAAQRNPMKTTTYGTGELIHAAMENRSEHIYIGIGGSATVDGGTGMAQALGVHFFNKEGQRFTNNMTGGDLINIRRISTQNLSPLVQQTQFTVACDVNNPWLGPQGAAFVFGPQKGATPEMVQELDAGLKNLAGVIKRDLGVDVADYPGGGAAGGLGGMLYALLQAEMRSGIEIVLEQIGFADCIKNSDLIVTGEGRVDSQTVGGKTISGVVKAARKYKVPVLVIGGSIVEQDLSILYESGIDATLSLVSTPMNLTEAIENGASLMTQTGERVGRLIRCFQPCFASI
ncbi:MAG: glycerate kinase [SAR324 cluster bacterium]|nr:glycerate kinase [SAR324 cluster bacterium]